VLLSIYETKEYVLANGAPRHDAGSLHVQMRLGKPPYCTTVCTLSLCGRNIHGEDLAQVTRGGIPVDVISSICSHFRSPVGPKRSVLILLGSLPEAVRRLETLSTNDVGPHT